MAMSKTKAKKAEFSSKKKLINKGLKVFILFILVFEGRPENSFANEYLPMIGKGVNMSETRTFGQCVKGVTLETETKNIALQQRYHERQIKSHEDLQNSLEMNAAASAKGLWGTATGNFSSFNGKALTKESFYWLVDANYELSREAIKTNAQEFDLTDRAKQLLQLGIDQFYAGCGTHFYTGRKVGGRYSILYEFKSQDDRSVGRLNAAASYSGFGIKASADFKKYVEMATKSSSLEITSYIQGGDQTIQSYPKDPDELITQLDLFKDKLVREGRGVVLHWYLESYDQFPEVFEAKVRAQGKQFLDQFRTDALARYYQLYTFNKSQIREQEDLIRKSSGLEPYFIFSKDKIDKILESIDQLVNQNSEIEARARECLSTTIDGVCKTNDLIQIYVESPKPDKDLSQLGNWEIVPLFESVTPENGTPFFDLIATPGEEYKPRIFSTREKLFSDANEQAYVLAKHFNHVKGQVKIGKVTPVVDPNSGLYRPALCIGDFEKICNLRIIENPDATFNGYPASKMQLTLFDDLGFIYKKVTFFVRK